MRINLIIFFWILIFSQTGFSQSGNDSIKRVAYTSEIDSMRAKALVTLAYNSHLNQPDSAFVWAETALILGDKLKMDKVRANAYLVKGLVRSVQSRHEEAINFYNEAIPVYYKINKLSIVAGCLSNIALVYTTMTNYPKAIEYMLKATTIAEKSGDKKVVATCLGNLGHISYEKGDYDAAIEYNKKSLAIREEIKDMPGIAILYNNIGLNFAQKKNYAEALTYHEKSLAIKRELDDQFGIIYSLENIGTVYLEKAKVSNDKALFSKANKYYNEALALALKLEERQGISECYKYLAEIDVYLGHEKEAIEKLKKSIEISRSIEFNQLTLESYKYLSNLYDKAGDHKNAFLTTRALMSLKDSILNKENNRQMLEMESKYNNEKNQWEIQKLQGDKKFNEEIRATQRKINLYLIVAVILVGLVGVVIFIGFLNKRKANRIIHRQKEEVDKKNLEIEQQKKLVEYQRDLVEDKNKEIVDSINYAKKIQYALLAHEDFLKANLPEHFILFKPKDIVSGDFYWAAQKGNKFYIAVCDSTGHGVPGAFMSLLNISFLNEAVNEKNILSPNEIFNHVRKRLIESITEENQKDGMDGVLICFEGQKITYAAANNKPLLINGDKMIELEHDKMPVGKGEKEESYRLFNIKFTKGDTLFLFTDGYADQFGGPKGKKYKHKTLQELLRKNSSMKIPEQQQALYTVFKNWRGNLEQVDDVCVMGIRL